MTCASSVLCKAELVDHDGTLCYTRFHETFLDMSHTINSPNEHTPGSDVCSTGPIPDQFCVSAQPFKRRQPSLFSKPPPQTYRPTLHLSILSVTNGITASMLPGLQRNVPATSEAQLQRPASLVFSSTSNVQTHSPPFHPFSHQ